MPLTPDLLDVTVSPTALPAHLRGRVPDGDGQYIVARDGDAPPAGCIIGRLPSGEVLYLVEPVGEDVDGNTLYGGWALMGPPVIEIE